MACCPVSGKNLCSAPLLPGKKGTLCGVIFVLETVCEALDELEIGSEKPGCVVSVNKSVNECPVSIEIVRS